MDEKGELDHDIGAATTRACPDQNVWGRIYSEWFPSSIFEQQKGKKSCGMSIKI